MENQNIKNFPRYERYKDSGVIEIDQIPFSWQINRLGNILSSKTVKGRDDLPLLSITREKGVILRDLDDLDSNHNYIPDDLSNYKVIQMGEFGMNKMKAWQGSYGVSLHSGIVSPAYYIFEFRKYFDKSFFHYAIRSNFYIGLFYRASDGVRIGQWDLSQTRMKEIPFVYPSEIKEQTAIAQFLDHKTAQIDRAIAIKEEQIKLLNERKQIMIQEAVTKGLDPTVPMKDSGVEWIGEIPEHWEVKSLGSLLNIISERNRADLPLLSITRELGIILRDINNLDANHNYIPDDLSNYKVIREGQFGMNKMKAWQGSYGISKYDGIVSPAYYVFELSGEIYSDFFHHAIRSQLYVGLFFSASDGVRIGQWDLSQVRMRKISFIIPTIEEQKEIVNYIKSYFLRNTQTINHLNDEIKVLKEYKTTLINEAVTGKIKVN